MQFHKNEIAALTRMFSAGVLRELGKQGESPLFARLVGQTRLAESDGSVAISQTFDRAFEALKAIGVRDEYVYRSAITQKILLGRHSLNTASIINEARAGACKADVVVLNGTSTAYEIKSERDSLARLSNQVRNYQKVFASVYVVSSPSHLKDILDLVPQEVGLMTLSKRFTLTTHREAQNSPEQTSPQAILDSLRVSEAVSLLENLGHEVPKVPNTQARAILANLFASLDPASAHNEMVAILRRSRSQSAQAQFVKSVPASLRSAALSAKLSESHRSRIKQAVGTPLKVALSWG